MGFLASKLQIRDIKRYKKVIRKMKAHLLQSGARAVLHSNLKEDYSLKSLNMPIFSLFGH